MDLEQLAGLGNFADRLDEQTQNELARVVIEGFELDLESSDEWRQRVEKAEKLLAPPAEKKSYPWPNAANVRYPLLMQAVIQYGERAFAGIQRNNKLVLARVIGDDPVGEKQARADRVSTFMSWQMTADEEFEREIRGAFYHQAVAGLMFLKATWSNEENRPSVAYRRSTDVVVHAATKSLTRAPRITDRVMLYPIEIETRMRAGRFRRCDLPIVDRDSQALQEVLEQHLVYDLDKDGLPEPYIAHVHRDSAKLLSIEANFRPEDVVRAIERQAVPRMFQDPYSGEIYQEMVEIDVPGPVLRIKRRDVFVDFPFFPDARGSFYPIGLGALLESPQEIIDATLNQLLDAGTLQNAGGGFIGRGVSFDSRDGVISVSPGEWRAVNADGRTLRDSIVPLPAAGPSPVMFTLLGLLIDSAKSTAGMSDVLTGEAPAGQAMGATLALIEQGLQVFTGIAKANYRGLKKLYDIIYALNGEFVAEDAYAMVLDIDPQERNVSAAADFNQNDYDIRPVADPQQITDVQRMMRAQVAQQFVGAPGVNAQAVIRRVMEAAGIDDIDDLMSDGADPALQARAEAEIADLKSDAILKIARATQALAQAEAAAGPIGDAVARQGYQELSEVMGNGGQPRGPMGGRGGAMAQQPMRPRAPMPPRGPQGGNPAAMGQLPLDLRRGP